MIKENKMEYGFTEEYKVNCIVLIIFLLNAMKCRGGK